MVVSRRHNLFVYGTQADQVRLVPSVKGALHSMSYGLLEFFPSIGFCKMQWPRHEPRKSLRPCLPPEIVVAGRRAPYCLALGVWGRPGLRLRPSLVSLIVSRELRLVPPGTLSARHVATLAGLEVGNN
jgi:hypothetical protein